MVAKVAKLKACQLKVLRELSLLLDKERSFFPHVPAIAGGVRSLYSPGNSSSSMSLELPANRKSCEPLHPKMHQPSPRGRRGGTDFTFHWFGLDCVEVLLDKLVVRNYAIS